jgi:CBS domain-containing protein
MMKNRTPISTIMSTNLVTLSVTDTLETAENLFKNHNIRHIPVVNNAKLVGMLSYSDLLRISFADVTNDEQNVDSFVYDMFTIQQVMAKNITTVSTDSTIKEVAKIFAEREFHALPVVDEGVLEGIITTTDLSLYLLTELN